MKIIFPILFIALIACSSASDKNVQEVKQYSLADFYSPNASIDQRVDEIFNDLDYSRFEASLKTGYSGYIKFLEANQLPHKI